jgi:nucleoid DNA-binding protein
MSATKDDLCKAFRTALEENNIVVNDMSYKKAGAIVDLALDTILQLVKTNEQIRTPIGIFKFVEKSARKAINPRTGEKVDVAAYKTLTFKAAKSVKE